MISLCMVVRNGGRKVRKAINSVSKLVGEIVVVDQDSDDGSSEWLKEKADIYIRTTRKNLADLDRQYCYNLATGDWIISLDSDEYINGNLRKLIPHLEKSGFDVIWIPFKNLVDGVDIKELLGEDYHPRMWRRLVNGQVNVEWSQRAHTFPKFRSNAQLWLSRDRGEIVHDRKYKDVKKTHEERMKVIDSQMRQVEQRFLNALAKIMERKR